MAIKKQQPARKATIYEDAVRTVDEVKTLSSHMSALGKIRARSEDQQLNNLVQSLVGALQLQYQQVNAVTRSTPTSLTFYPNMETQALIQYCRWRIGSDKPEWQVLAEQNGWAPPVRRF